MWAIDHQTMWKPAPTSLEAPFLIGRRRTTRYERFVKPCIDRAVASVLALALLPVLVVVAVVTRLSLGPNIILHQTRVGRDGESFTLRKFRTMYPDRRMASMDFAGEDRRRTHKHANDPRLTRVGKVLRSWSLDELPQLFDVLNGRLSVVGPRPELPEIVARYEPWQHARHAVKPGITGLWQIRARGNGEMHEHTEFDIAYAQCVTFLSDLKIMLLTIPAVLAHRGY
jgi:lipopolysaccharide/colanic/teichoic acid biosynthesis glycosyltransferase